MEYNYSETSSNSESGSLTTNHEKDITLKKIAELKKKIAELENTTIMKKENKNKVKKESLNQRLVVEKSFDDMTTITNKAKGSLSQSLNNNKLINKSQPTISEDDIEFSSDEPMQVTIIIQII